MKFFLVLLASAIPTLAIPPKLEDYLPPCSIDCIRQAISSSNKCAPLDSVCWCQPANWADVSAFSAVCILKACGVAKATNEVLPAAQKFCAAASAAAPHAAQEAVPSTDSSHTTTSMAILTGSATVQGINETTITTFTGPASTASDGAGAVGTPLGGLGAFIFGILAAF